MPPFLQKVAMAFFFLAIVTFTSLVAVPAIVDSLIQSADSVGSHQRIERLDREMAAR